MIAWYLIKKWRKRQAERQASLLVEQPDSRSGDHATASIGTPGIVRARVAAGTTVTGPAAVADVTRAVAETVIDAQGLVKRYGSLVAIDQLLAEFDLREKAEALAETLSGGQMQRLSIALALVNDPDLVFLDEPTTGLDPQARLNLWDVIEGVQARGKTVILTTHYMEEAERLCDRVAVIDRGHIVALDTPVRLIAIHAPGASIEFETTAPDLEALGAMPGVDRAERDGDRVVLRTRKPEPVLASLFSPNGPAPSIQDLRVRQGTLEDVFITLTGRRLRS